MFAGLFASRRTKSLVRREQRRPATGFEALEPRLAMAVTLVIDPSNLKLPATSSAWVAGYANVQGGKADQPFTWLASSGANAAKFVVPTSTTDSGAALPMIQIWGGDVSGTTTITIDTTAIGPTYKDPQLAGGQLQIFVSPTNTQPSGPTLSGGVATITNVAVTQVNSPPYLSTQIVSGMVPFDLVEFTYLPDKSSTFDVDDDGSATADGIDFDRHAADRHLAGRHRHGVRKVHGKRPAGRQFYATPLWPRRISPICGAADHAGRPILRDRESLVLDREPEQHIKRDTAGPEFLLGQCARYVFYSPQHPENRRGHVGRERADRVHRDMH